MADAEMGGEEDLTELACRVEGWLNVWEVDRSLSHTLFALGRSPVPIWEPYFCVLHRPNKRLIHNRSEKDGEERHEASGEKPLQVVRLDGCKADFDKRWGYETLESIKENAIQHFPFEWGKDRLFPSFPRKFNFKSASLDVFSSRSQTLDNRSSASSNASSNNKDSAYEKGLGERRGSVPVVNTVPLAEDNMEVPSTPSRLASFFSKKVIKSNLKRTKSVTKLDRKRTINNDVDGSQSPSTRPKLASSLRRTMSLGRLARRWNPRSPPPPTPPGSEADHNHFRNNSLHHHHHHHPADSPAVDHKNYHQQALINSRMRTSRSHESLLMTTHSAMHSIDLSAPDVEIKPLHSSILGQDHCFQVSTTNGSKYYSCRSAHERQKWIQSLRKTVMPNQEQTVRTENSLKLWVLEAKNCPPKKRYFCELCLDKTLYARTSTKQKNEMLFWGEQFDFNNLPPVEVITINLYREADKKKKKEKNVLIGYVHLCVADVNGRQLTEKWYTASSAVVGKAGKEMKGELPLVRIKARYQTVTILPMDLYTPLINYMQTDFQMLVEVLEPLISVKAKEEIATTMVNILQRLGTASTFLPDIVMAEVDKIDNENLTFRGNSIATKAMESYMKLVGEKYIQDTLGDFIRTVLDSTDDCEVDPTRVPNNLTLQRHQKNLVMYCEMVWFKIINSYCFFPRELRAVFSALASQCSDRKRPDVSNHLVSACVFLRFLCPAILSPSLFNLTQEYPQERAARNLTLIAKTIQNLANFTKFGSKEEYMTFMNDFVDRELESMKTFTQQISNPEEKCSAEDFDGYIDLGKQLSILHTVLCESLDKMNEGAEVKLGRLKRILGDLTTAKENPNSTLRRLNKSQPDATPNTNSVHLYDNVSSNNVSPPTTSRQNSHDNNDPNANTNATNHLLTTLMADYNDADLSRSQDLPVVPSQLDSQSAMVQSGRVHSLAQRPYQTVGARLPTRPPAADPHSSSSSSSTHRSAFDDYVMFSPLVDNRRVANNHNVAQVRTMPLRTERINEQQVNHSWNKMVTAADLVNGQDYIDLISFMDDAHSSDGVQNSSAELDNGSQVSIGQLSTVASSGYQSFGYSQSSSPVDSSSVQQESGSSSSSASSQPLSFANPLFQHQNHCHTQTLLPAGVINPNLTTNGAPNPEQLPRVMSSSSLSSEEGTLSSSHSSSAQRHQRQPSNRKHQQQQSTSSKQQQQQQQHQQQHHSQQHQLQNGRHHSNHNHRHHTNNHRTQQHQHQQQQQQQPVHSVPNTDTDVALRKLSNLSCSSSSCESLGGAGDHSLRRGGSSTLHNGQSPSHTNSRRTPPYPLLSHSHSLDSRCNVAFDISPIDGSTDDGPMTLNELSRSVELPHYNHHQNATSPQQQRMRRTQTADAILTPPVSSRGQYSNRKQSTPQNTVRMGIRSVQQRQQAESDKHKADYEAELTLLRQQLAETQAMLQETQRRLNIHDTDSLTSDEWSPSSLQSRMDEARLDKDSQMKGIIKRLLTVEEARRAEQHQLQAVVDEKQHIIEMQERRLVALDMANGRLLSAINQIKEQSLSQQALNAIGQQQPAQQQQQQYQQRANSKLPPQQHQQQAAPSATILSLAESGQFRTSSC